LGLQLDTRVIEPDLEPVLKLRHKERAYVLLLLVLLGQLLFEYRYHLRHLRHLHQLLK
jgi:hypothetical protein